MPSGRRIELTGDHEAYFDKVCHGSDMIEANLSSRTLNCRILITTCLAKIRRKEGRKEASNNSRVKELRASRATGGLCAAHTLTLSPVCLQQNRTIDFGRSVKCI